MAFHDERFPLTLAFGATGGPTRSVDIATLSSGREHRNTTQSRARRRYNAVTGVKSLADAQTLAAFFEARGGALHSFRFRDPVDHSADGALLGVGDGARTAFDLRKTYGDAVRPIVLPVADTVEVLVAGEVVSHQLSGGTVTIDPPAPGALVTARFEFDVPVRFDTDELVLALETDGAISVSSVPLVEVLGEVPHA